MYGTPAHTPRGATSNEYVIEGSNGCRRFSSPFGLYFPASGVLSSPARTVLGTVHVQMYLDCSLNYACVEERGLNRGRLY